MGATARKQGQDRRLTTLGDNTDPVPARCIRSCAHHRPGIPCAVIIQLQLIDELFGMDCMHPAEVLRQLPAEGATTC